jgi:hypothetical protein
MPGLLPENGRGRLPGSQDGSAARGQKKGVYLIRPAAGLSKGNRRVGYPLPLAARPEQ